MARLTQLNQDLLQVLMPLDPTSIIGLIGRSLGEKPLQRELNLRQLYSDIVDEIVKIRQDHSLRSVGGLRSFATLRPVAEKLSIARRWKVQVLVWIILGEVEVKNA